MTAMKIHRLENVHDGRRNDPLVFEGEMIARVDTNQDRRGESKNWWTVLTLYRTIAGAFVLHKQAYSHLPHQDTWEHPYHLGTDARETRDAICRIVLDPLRRRKPGLGPWNPADGVSGPGSWMVRLLLQRAGLDRGERRVE